METNSDFLFSEVLLKFLNKLGKFINETFYEREHELFEKLIMFIQGKQ